VSGSASATFIASWSRSTIGLGVPLGATIANQELKKKSGRPDSLTVGTSGYCASRCGVDTASRRSLPAAISEVTVPRPWKAASTSPPATAMAAGVAPL